MAAKTSNNNKNTKPNLNDQLVTTGQIANMMGIVQSNVSYYRKNSNTFPKPAFKYGLTTLYWRDEVENFISEKMGQREHRADNLEARAKELLESAKRLRSK